MMIRFLMAAALICSAAEFSGADDTAAVTAQNATEPSNLATGDSLTSTPSEQKTEWESDYGRALAATRQDDRPLLVLLEDPSNPNGQIDSQFMSEANKGVALLEPYHLCRIDATTDYGKKVVRAFGAESLPHAAIIDKSGAVVLFKQSGPITQDQWKTALTNNRTGERRSRAAHTTFYRGVVSSSQSDQPAIQSYPTYSTQPTMSSPSYCPSCQRRGMQGF